MIFETRVAIAPRASGVCLFVFFFLFFSPVRLCRGEDVTEPLRRKSYFPKLFVRRKELPKVVLCRGFREETRARSQRALEFPEGGINAGISCRSLADKCVSRARDDE